MTTLRPREIDMDWRYQFAVAQTSPPGPLSRGETGRQPRDPERVTVLPFLQEGGTGVGLKKGRREIP